MEEQKSQLQEARRQHESTMQAFQYSQSSDKNTMDNEYVYSLKDKLENEQKRNDEIIEDLKKKLQSQISELNAKNDELEFKLKIKESDSEKEKTSLKEALGQSEQQRQQFLLLNKNLEKQQ